MEGALNVGVIHSLQDHKPSHVPLLGKYDINNRQYKSYIASQ